MLSRMQEHSSFSTNAAWSVSDLQGLDLATRGKHDVHFAIARDAGKLDADGFVNGTDGAGLFRFTPSPTYIAAMAALGFGDITEDKQLSYAIHDVSLAFAKDMKSQGIAGLDGRMLISFRVFHVDDAFIAALKTAGLQNIDARHLIAFRVHGVTPDYVLAVHKLGLFPTQEQFTAMRIHDVTPEYIAGLQSHGVKNLTVEQVIRLKISNIT
jgi:hypothetical protein